MTDFTEFTNMQRFSSFRIIHLLIFQIILQLHHHISNASLPRGYFTDTQKNIRLVKNVFATFQNIEHPQNCVIHCMANEKCKSVNFNKDLEICELLDVALNSHGSSLFPIEANGWVYYGPKNQQGNCGDVNFRTQQSYGGHNICCPKGTSGKYCSNKNMCAMTFLGFCTDSEGTAQNTGEILLKNFSSNEVNIAEKCLDLCRSNSKATGFELETNLSNSYCRVHTDDIGWGINYPEDQAVCWKLFKCDANETYSCRYGYGDINANDLNPSHTIQNINSEGQCNDKCLVFFLENGFGLYTMYFNEETSVCKCISKQIVSMQYTTYANARSVCVLRIEKPTTQLAVPREGSDVSKPARSCRRLKERQPETITGYYWIDLGFSVKKVWCDMDTDGGGWMLIAHTKVTQSVINTYSSITDSNMGYPFVESNFALPLNYINIVSSATMSTDVRFRCTKVWHQRTLDLAVVNSLYFNKLIQLDVSTTFPSRDLCGKIKFLNDAQSGMRTSYNADCTTLRPSHHYNPLYNFPLFVLGNYHISIWQSNRMECDDTPHSSSTQQGEWWYYIR